MPNTTKDSAAITTTKINAQRTSMVNAITVAPSTIKGDRKNRRNARFTPFCVWVTSLVIRVINEERPKVSSSEKLKLWIFPNRLLRSSLPKPVAARAAKNWAVIAITIPTTAKPTNKAQFW